MIKFKDSYIVFEEIPDMVSLAINLTNCQNNCIGCHSPELRKNIGEELTENAIDKLISENFGVNCVLFMGEGNDKDSLLSIAKYIKEKYSLKTAIYSGRKNVEEDFYRVFDFIKIGSYIEKFGPLNVETTNQRLFLVEENGINDITYKFWRKGDH